MSFTYPAFLFALSAVAIPIIIHLFNFRKFKTIYFSNVRFLKEVKQETQAKSKLKHLLVLAARILSIIFLVLAFAQPFIPSANNQKPVGDKTVSIFIDNSFSMEAINKNGTLLDEAKKRALEIIAAYKPTDRFQLLTNDFEGKHQRLVNKEEFIELMDEVKISPITRSLSEITLRQTDVLNQVNKNKVSFILSDFQKTMMDWSALKNDTAIQFKFIPLIAAEKSNVSIDTCWFESPFRQYNQIEKLHVRIKNVSEKVLEKNSIKLFINDVQKTPASFDLDKNSETEIVLSFTSKETGVQHCRIELNDYPVTFDDKFYFTFEVEKNIPVMTISGADFVIPSSDLKRLFGSDSLFVYSEVSENKIDYSALNKNKLLVINELKNIPSGLAQSLKKFIENGGTVLVFPNKELDLVSYKDFFLSVRANFYERLDTANSKVDKINMEHMLYKDVFDKKTFSSTNLDLPKVNEHFVISKTTRSNEEYLLKLQNGEVFLSTNLFGKGKLYIAAVGLSENFSNLTKHAIFVPTLYKIAMHSQVSQPLFYTIGKEDVIESNKVVSGENVFHITNKAKKVDIIPEHKLVDSKTAILVHNQIKEANNYDLLANTDLIGGVSYNFNRNESDLVCYKAQELSEKLITANLSNMQVIEIGTQILSTSLIEMEQGKKLWKLCVILALLFLAAEVALLRFMK